MGNTQMLDKAERNKVALNIWTARIIPIVLAGVVGYATYVFVALLCGRLLS
jgi:palmitoyltransferase